MFHFCQTDKVKADYNRKCLGVHFLTHPVDGRRHSTMFDCYTARDYWAASNAEMRTIASDDRDIFLPRAAFLCKHD